MLTGSLPLRTDDETGLDFVSDESDSWWTISGDTPGERMRSGWLQILLLAGVVWLGALVVYNTVAFAIDPITATAVLLVGGLFVGFKLKEWLVKPGVSEGDTAHEGNGGTDPDDQ